MSPERLTAPGAGGLGASGRLDLSAHQLSEGDFDALAAGADDVAVVRRLAASERSHRRVVLRALLDRMADRPDIAGPLAPLDEAWELLVRAEATDLRAAAVVDYPLTGVWAMLLLRRLHGVRYDDVPLWVEAGGLHLLAVAAAVRAGLTFELTVPMRRGTVVMPTLGLARLPHRDPWEVAELSVAGDDVRVAGGLGEATVRVAHLRASRSSSRDTPSGFWVPAAAIGAAHDGARIDVVLDDVDPYRHVVSSTLPAPIGGAEVGRWEAVLDSGWQLLVRDHPTQAQAITATLRVIVPTMRAPRFMAGSATSGDAFGAALISEPTDPAELAATLVHELQHAKLGALQHLVDLTDVDRADRCYAPWRQDPRPASGLLQGIYAFFGVTGFWRVRRQVTNGVAAALAHFEFALWRAAVDCALTELRARPELTALGHRFLQGVATTLDGWLTEPVPSGPRRFARAAGIDHHAGWRLHHLVAEPGAVAELVAVWVAGHAAPPGVVLTRPALVGDPAVRGLESRALLIRHLLGDPAAVASWRDGGDVGDQVRGAVPSDLEWLVGDAAGAAAGFERILEDEDADDPHAWAGLGLVAFDLGDHAAARALARVPELVRALSRELALPGLRPGRLEVARWLGAAL